MLIRLGRVLLPTFRYWLETEPHVYAMAIAANVLLSFFPFLIVMVSLFTYVFYWQGAVDAIFFALRDYFPDELGRFVRNNLMATVWARGPAQLVSLILLLFASMGIFMPLEVSLNKLWGVTSNRSYIKNQLISIGLIFLAGGAALLSIMLTAINQQFLREQFGTNAVTGFVAIFFFKMAALPLGIAVLFLLYWKLPNAKLPVAPCLQAAIFTGLGLEAMKYIFVLAWPHLIGRLALEYGPFKYSVSLILFGFFAAMLLLAGGEWAARSHRITQARRSMGQTSPLGLHESRVP